MNRRRVLRALLVAGAVSGAATACGQKGPLFLPEEKLEEMERKREAEKARKTSRGPSPAPASRRQA